MNKVVDFENKRSVKEGITPPLNCLQDAIENVNRLDTVLVLARTSDGDFQMWASGTDGDSPEWVLIMEVCKSRIINGLFGG